MLRSAWLVASGKYRAGSKNTSTAADTAPQPLWPRTTTTFRLPPKCSTAYFQTPQHLVAETVSRDTDYEKVIGALIEYELDRNTSIRTAQYRCEGPLLWTRLARPKSKVLRVHLDDTAGFSTLICQAFDQCSKSPTSLVKTAPRCVRVDRTRPHRFAFRVSIDNLDAFHIATCVGSNAPPKRAFRLPPHARPNLEMASYRFKPVR